MPDDKDFVIDLKSIKVSDREKKEVNQTIPATKPLEVENIPEKPVLNRTREISRNRPIELPIVKPKKGIHLPNQKLVMTIALFIVVALIALGSYFILKSNENYYFGIWNVQLSEQDKQSGIKKITYDINNSSITQNTENEANGVKANVVVKYETELIESRSAGAYFKIRDIKLSSMDITIDPSLCNNDERACNLIRDNYRKSFEDFLNKQKADLVNQSARISPSENHLRLIIANREEVKLSK